jgi:hypothetical protein
MNKVCILHPWFIDSSLASPIPAPFTSAVVNGKNIIVYVGSLRSAAVAYEKNLRTCSGNGRGDVKSSVVNIGKATPPYIYKRLANNKHAHFSRMAAAWGSGRCSVDSINYHFLTCKGVRKVNCVDFENCVQFLFGFAAGGLPILDRIQNSGVNRRASVCGLCQLASVGFDWRLVFPSGNGCFHSRLDWVLGQLRGAASGKGSLTLKGATNASGEIVFKGGSCQAPRKMRKLGKDITAKLN